VEQLQLRAAGRPGRVVDPDPALQVALAQAAQEDVVAVLPERTMAQYIYTMNRVAKIVPPKRYILRDISLSFYPGAKIGVLG
jgi:hypothetical protein